MLSLLLATSALAACFLQAAAAPLRPALAETYDIEAELTDEQLVVEETAVAYEEAQARLAEIEMRISDNEARLAEIEDDLPEQQERAASAVGELYKLQQESVSLIELVLGSRSLSEFLKNYQYLTYIYDRNISEVKRLASMRTELEETSAALDVAREEAEQESAAAADALAAAQEARERAQREAEERAAAEEAARQAAAEEAEEAEGATEGGSEAEAVDAVGEESATGSTTTSSSESVTSSPTSDGADWSSDKASFVASWGARIDAYLAGSPLAGYGETFAAAAWDYGIDPRFSPAISTVESSKGAVCFLPYNAWGWGSVSWSSWEEAINAHVRGLARGYGYTLTEEGAQRYCPSNWEHWYNRVAEEMNKI